MDMEMNIMKRPKFAISTVCYLSKNNEDNG